MNGRELLEALQAMTPEELDREMVDTLTARYRSLGWSDGYDAGLTDGEDRY